MALQARKRLISRAYLIINYFNNQKNEKEILFAAVALVMSVATAVGYKAYDKGNMSEFMMANIEALTESEGSGKCFASLACSMVNAPQNTVYCEGEQECHRYPDKRYVECDGVASYCHG